MDMTLSGLRAAYQPKPPVVPLPQPKLPGAGSDTRSGPDTGTAPGPLSRAAAHALFHAMVEHRESGPDGDDTQVNGSGASQPSAGPQADGTADSDGTAGADRDGARRASLVSLAQSVVQGLAMDPSGPAPASAATAARNYATRAA